MVSLPEPVAATLDSWLDAHDEVAPGTIEGLYVVGSVAFGDWTPHSDIDVVPDKIDLTITKVEIKLHIRVHLVEFVDRLGHMKLSARAAVCPV